MTPRSTNVRTIPEGRQRLRRALLTDTRPVVQDQGVDGILAGINDMTYPIWGKLHRFGLRRASFHRPGRAR